MKNGNGQRQKQTQATITALVAAVLNASQTAFITIESNKLRAKKQKRNECPIIQKFTFFTVSFLNVQCCGGSNQFLYRLFQSLFY
jgi:hypothetical protein